MRDETKKKIYLYVFLAFLITWVLEIPAFYLANKHGFDLPTIHNLGLYKEIGVFGTPKFYSYLLFTIAVYGPLLSSLLTIIMFRDSLREHLKKLFTTSIQKKTLILLLLYFPLASILTVLVSYVVSGAGIQPFYPFIYFFPFLLLETLTAGFEEFGWRGYLLPKLLKLKDAESASYMIGVIWSIWHWPFLYYFFDMPQLHIFIPILIGNVLSMIPMSIIYTWIYRNSKGVVWHIIFHGLGNTVPLFIATQSENPFVMYVQIVVVWVVAWGLGKRYGKELRITSRG